MVNKIVAHNKRQKCRLFRSESYAFGGGGDRDKKKPVQKYSIIIVKRERVDENRNNGRHRRKMTLNLRDLYTYA